MRTFKRLFLLLLLLAVAALIVTQWWVRSSGGVSSFERRVKALTGLETEIGAVRLGWNLDFLVTDLALVLEDTEYGDHVLLSAPAVTFSCCCDRRTIRVSRPVIKAVQSQRGEWAPSQLKDFADREASFKALYALSASIQKAFDITDAVFVMQGAEGDEIVSFSGINWYHAPVCLSGRSGMMHNVFSVQCVDRQPVSLASEWLSDSQGTYFLSSSDAWLEAGSVAESSNAVEHVVSDSDVVVQTDSPAKEDVEVSVTVREETENE